MTDVPIVVRNLRFAIDDEIPRYWMAQPKAFTLFVDHLSMVFPAGEGFFIASVRAFEKQVTDPKLREDIRAFNQQEALHSREHARFNDLLKRQGHPVDAIDRSARRILGSAKLFLSKRMQLSITCALEHYTALFAQVVLNSNDTLLKDAHPTMAAMWRWHAAEENEHSSVAFDVFKTVGGTHFERCLGLVLVSIFFWAKMVEHQVRMMHAAKILWSREWLGLWPVLFGTPSLAFTLFRPYFAYFKPSFHPRDLDCVELLDRWKADFSTQPEYLRSLTVKAA